MVSKSGRATTVSFFGSPSRRPFTMRRCSECVEYLRECVGSVRECVGYFRECVPLFRECVG